MHTVIYQPTGQRVKMVARLPARSSRYRYGVKEILPPGQVFLFVRVEFATGARSDVDLDSLQAEGVNLHQLYAELPGVPQFIVVVRGQVRSHPEGVAESQRTAIGWLMDRPQDLLASVHRVDGTSPGGFDPDPAWIVSRPAAAGDITLRPGRGVVEPCASAPST